MSTTLTFGTYEVEITPDDQDIIVNSVTLDSSITIPDNTVIVKSEGKQVLSLYTRSVSNGTKYNYDLSSNPYTTIIGSGEAQSGTFTGLYWTLVSTSNETVVPYIPGWILNGSSNINPSTGGWR